MDLEFKFHLPVGRSERDAREEPAGFGGVRACETNVLISADDGAAAKVEPAGLKVGVEVRLLDWISGCGIISSWRVVDLPATSYGCAKEWILRLRRHHLRIHRRPKLPAARRDPAARKGGPLCSWRW